MMLIINFILALPKIYGMVCDIQKAIKVHNEQIAIDKINQSKTLSEQDDATKKFVASL